jgi:hypothetical protein
MALVALCFPPTVFGHVGSTACLALPNNVGSPCPDDLESGCLGFMCPGIMTLAFAIMLTFAIFVTRLHVVGALLPTSFYLIGSFRTILRTRAFRDMNPLRLGAPTVCSDDIQTTFLVRLHSPDRLVIVPDSVETSDLEEFGFTDCSSSMDFS